ncbi:MAG TPA: hypothetical protein VH280_06845 [Verrucomicrobiae bacterium]|nr:hypothetical protein [Verrucomicrobiae bacterium]
MAETVQKNFRMSHGAITILHNVARARGMTETDVVETCVAKYALEIGQEVDRAREVLFRQICGAMANAPVTHPRASESPALNEGPRRGKEAAETAANPSAAGALASMAAEGWADEKKEKGKGKK